MSKPIFASQSVKIDSKNFCDGYTAIDIKTAATLQGKEILRTFTITFTNVRLDRGSAIVWIQDTCALSPEELADLEQLRIRVQKCHQIFTRISQEELSHVKIQSVGHEPDRHIILSNLLATSIAALVRKVQKRLGEELKSAFTPNILIGITLQDKAKFEESERKVPKITIEQAIAFV